jgi:hypothetical protein
MSVRTQVVKFAAFLGQDPSQLPQVFPLQSVL